MDENYDRLKRKLRKVFKLEHFKSTAQKDAVKAISMPKQEVDYVISFPPGQGKSVCYQLPGLMQENKLTIVFSLSNTLIKDQIYFLQKSKICAKAITTTTSEIDIERVLLDLNSDQPETKFLYMNPEQANTDTFNNALQKLHTNDKLAYVAVYDAHASEYTKFGSLRSKWPSVPWITLTSKISTEVRNDIVNNFQLRKPIVTFQKSSFRKNLHYDVVCKNKIADHFVHLQNFVTKSLGVPDDKVKQSKKPCGIVYCRNRDSVELVAKELTQQGVSTKAYHSGLRTRDRTKVLEDWIAGLFPVIIVTSSFSGGIDKSSVRFVVHWDVPQSVDSYYKESGRAGRDGRSSYCRLYYCEEHVNEIYSKLQTAHKSKSIDFVKMRSYCESNECRHKWLAIYFDDGPPECKDRCDVCKSAIHLDDYQREIPLTSNSNSHPVRIKEEPDSPHHLDPREINYGTTNGQFIKLELQDTQTTYEDQTHGNASPARTIIKEECTDVETQDFSNWSDMQPQPPGNASPARTIIKEEIETPADIDNKAGIRPPSPAETVLEDESAPNMVLNIKREVVIPSRPISPIEVKTPKSIQNNIKIEPMQDFSNWSDCVIDMQPQPPGSVSPARTIVKEEMDRPPSPAEILIDESAPNMVLNIKREVVSPSRPISPISVQFNNFKREPVSPEECQPMITVDAPIIIALEKPNRVAEPNDVIQPKDPPTQVEQPYTRLTPSPTNTIIKDDRQSPNDFSENGYNNTESSRPVLPVESIHVNKNERNSEHKSRKRSRSRSSERRIHKREPVDDRRHHSSLASPRNGSCVVSDPKLPNSTTEYGNTTCLNDDNSSEERRPRYKREHDDNRNRENNNSRKSDHDKRKREHKGNRRHEPSQSSSSKTTNRRDSPSKEGRKRRRSYDSDSSYEDKQIHSRRKRDYKREKRNQVNRSRNRREINLHRTISSDECRSPQPSTSTGPRKQNVKNWSDIRLPVSPESSPSHKLQLKDDSDTDYGWEDPAPPKPKPEVSSKSAFEDMDPEYKEKVNTLTNEIKNEFDLDVITAKKFELFQVIEHSIEVQSKKKLDDLGKEIQKRKDDHIRKLFGTDNFDSWDNDPAVSNVKMARKLKQLKPLVSDDVPLMEKMNMKHVIIQMHANRLTQSHQRNELVLQGQIKKIETKFQGQLTPELQAAIKKEKSIIAETVKKYMMPYYLDRKIQPIELFPHVARKICHIFYDRFADENIIRDYIDDLFKNVGIVTPSTNII